MRRLGSPRELVRGRFRVLCVSLFALRTDVGGGISSPSVSDNGDYSRPLASDGRFVLCLFVAHRRSIQPTEFLPTSPLLKC